MADPLAVLTEAVETIRQANPTGQQVTGPTPAIEWRKNRSQLQILPSGNVMRLKQAGIFDLIELGSIPQTLSTEAAQMAGPGLNLKSISEADLRKYVQVVNLVVCACAEEPKVLLRPVDNKGQPDMTAFPPEGSLYIDELTFSDRKAIFEWGNGLASRLRPFRPESAGTIPAA